MAEFDRGEFLFCGEPMTRDGCAYCGEHMALAYKPHRVLRHPSHAWRRTNLLGGSLLRLQRPPVECRLATGRNRRSC